MTTYTGNKLDRLALPVGGIGTGTLSVGGRGQLRDWEIINHSSKGFAPRHAFFAVSARQEERTLDCRLLEGALPEAVYEGTSGCPAQLPGVPRFSRVKCRTVYPFIEVALADAASPVEATLLSYNPFVPGDVEGSAWPVAVFEIELTNRTESEIEASVLLGCENFVGTDGVDSLPCKQRNRSRISADLGAVLMDGSDLPLDSELRGDFVIAVERGGGRFTSGTGIRGTWGNDIRTLFEHFATHGEVTTPTKATTPLGSVCLARTLPAGKSDMWRFYVAWRFPNRLAWSQDPQEARPVVGNHYARLGADAWRILQKFKPVLPGLREASVRFADALAGSDLPEPIREAALANLPALRSQTLFQTPDGRFFGYEGGHRDKRIGGTIGSCTHVWGYDLATSFLFPAIARSFRELQFGPSQHPDGAISFRTALPLKEALRYEKVAADGHLASIIGFYRDANLASNPNWARALWPRVRQAILFCWQEGSWDANKDGVMEGCQHNTMDVDYYGPNPLMQSLYVTALRCGAELSIRFGDTELMETCHRLAGAGARYLEKQLFNGEYFEQQIPRSTIGMKIDPRLACGRTGYRHQPDYQIGPGVLIDQMMGGLHACVCGVAEPASASIIHKALKSVIRYNYRRHIGRELNHMRAFALGQEPGVLMATWPRDGNPAIPFPYYCEVMTGFEHALAAHLLYHGEEAQAIQVIASLRSRYTGNQRNPFNEAEWGNHYARALASWGSVWAWTGQHYSAQSGELSFRDPGQHVVWPWFAGEGWGTIEITPGPRDYTGMVTVCHGTVRIGLLRIGSFSTPLAKRPTTHINGIGKFAFAATQ